MDFSENIGVIPYKIALNYLEYKICENLGREPKNRANSTNFMVKKSEWCPQKGSYVIKLQQNQIMIESDGKLSIFITISNKLLKPGLPLYKALILK